MPTAALAQETGKSRESQYGGRCGFQGAGNLWWERPDGERGLLLQAEVELTLYRGTPVYEDVLATLLDPKA